jgi:hypothetical protein
MIVLDNVLKGISLKPEDFVFDDTTDKIKVSTGTGSSVGDAISSAVSTGISSIPTANDTVKGLSSLAVAANFPSTGDLEATTPAYVTAAINTAIETALNNLPDVFGN